MSKIVIIVNTLKNNRGTEAVVRGMENIIHSSHSNADIYVAANDVDTEQLPLLPGITKNIRKSKFTRKNYFDAAIYMALKTILKNTQLATKFRYSKLLKYCKDADYILAVGADNYDNSYGMFNNLHELHTLLNVSCKGKLYLCDCSMGEKDITTEVISDLKLFEKITVREMTTANIIKKINNSFDISYFPDPAFTMKPEKVKLPDKWQYGKMVGVNLSNVVLSKIYGGNADIILEAYIKLIESIWEKKLIPVLIPHVMGGADLSAINKVYERCKDFGTIIKINENYNAAELKYLISNCCMFVGARTHSTIAAYSSCVPTLVVGYSIKSIGIARDLFGTENNYVLPVDQLKDKNQLTVAFDWLFENRNEIEAYLKQQMDKYIEKAYQFGTLIGE